MSPARDPSGEELRKAAACRMTTLNPGEILVLRVPPDWAPLEVRQLQDALRYPAREFGVEILVVPAVQVTVTQPPPDPFG